MLSFGTIFEVHIMCFHYRADDNCPHRGWSYRIGTISTAEAGQNGVHIAGQCSYCWLACGEIICKECCQKSIKPI